MFEIPLEKATLIRFHDWERKVFEIPLEKATLIRFHDPGIHPAPGECCPLIRNVVLPRAVPETEPG